MCDELRSTSPKLFLQNELNDLVRDLYLPKQSAELLGSRLKSKNLLSAGTHFSWYRIVNENYFHTLQRKIL